MSYSAVRIRVAAYYNEIDPFAAAWLRELIKRGLIADGVVDERSIVDVAPDDVREFTQCHFFAGIGGWSYALRLAGWPDDSPIWTGSCPCQPFSTAGKRKGFSDARHLWPHFFRLIEACRPVAVIGEQVASKDALAWLDPVLSDLEGAGYTCGAVDTCAAGFGAPHIRQRLYWVAHSMPAGWPQGRPSAGDRSFAGSGEFDGLAHTANSRSQGLLSRRERICDFSENGSVGGLDNPLCAGLEGHARNGGTSRGEGASRPVTTPVEFDTALPTNGFWRGPDWLWCRDKKWRPFIPSIPLLVDGIPCALGYDRNEYRCEEAVVNACVPILRQIFGTQEVSWWGFRMLDKFQQEEILQPNMYGTCDGKGCMQMCSPQPGESTFAYPETMCFMWGDKEVTCASFERRPYRQCPVQFDDLVPFLPPKSTFTKFFGCKWTAKVLQILWEALCEKWPMLHTSGAFAPFWASFSEEDKNRLRVALPAGSWRALSTSPTWYVGAFARKRNISQRLKGYGNAIVAPQAAEIIKAFMEVCDD